MGRRGSRGGAELLRAHPAALRRAAPAAVTSHALVLPRLSECIPGEVRLAGGGSGLADIAEALLAEGILQEGDWSTDLEASIDTGLDRWLNHDLRPGGIRSFQAQLVYVESLDHLELEYADDIHVEAQWRSEMEGLPHEPVRAFAIEGVEYGEVFCGHVVRRLNRIVPNAGWAAFRTACRALWHTVGAATPDWALDQYADRDDGWLEDDLEEDPDLLTYDRLEERLPEGSRYLPATVNPSAVLTAALGQRKRGPSYEALNAAMELHDLMAAGPAPDNHLRNALYGCEPVLAMSLRLDRTDWIDRVTDEYHERQLEADEGTSLMWLVGFQAGHPECTPRWAARQLRTVMETLAAADRLMMALVSAPEPRRTRERVRVRA